MTCSRSCSQCQSWDQSTGPSAVRPVRFPTAWQSSNATEKSHQSNAVTTGLTLCRCQHCMDTALRKHRTLLLQTSPWTPPLPGQSWPGQSTLRSRCLSNALFPVQSGRGHFSAYLRGPLVPTATSGVGQALNSGWAGRS